MRRVFGIALLTSLFAASVAYACRPVPAPVVQAWLGLTWYDEPATIPPANITSLVPVDGGEPLRHGAIELWRAPAGTSHIESFGQAIMLGAAIDETSPTQPVVREASMTFHEQDDGGCGGRPTTCGDITTFDLDIEASDDATPRGALTFAIWRSGTREDAPSRAPDYYLAPRDRGEGRTDVWNFESDEWEGRDTWVVVRVLDQAGNASPFSEPFLVDTGARGCAVRATSHTGIWLPLALAVFFARRRWRDGREAV